MLQIFRRSNNILTFTYLQLNYCSLSPYTGDSRIVGPRCAICFVPPFWCPEVVRRFLENFMDTSYTYSASKLPSSVGPFLRGTGTGTLYVKTRFSTPFGEVVPALQLWSPAYSRRPGFTPRPV